MALVRCPICKREFEARQSPAMPFCCERCRLVDLRRWLVEGYGLPHARDDDEAAIDTSEAEEPPED